MPIGEGGGGEESGGGGKTDIGIGETEEGVERSRRFKDRGIQICRRR